MPEGSRLSPLFELFAAEQRVRVLVGEAMAGAPLTPDEYAVYSVLFDEGPQSPTRLARRVGMPPTTMSHYVRAMRERRHARTRRHPEDGRSYELVLTRSGLAAHARAGRAFAEADLRFQALLGGETRAVLDALATVANAADGALADLRGVARAG